MVFTRDSEPVARVPSMARLTIVWARQESKWLQSRGQRVINSRHSASGEPTCKGVKSVEAWYRPGMANQ
ncbi:hypothetical protein TNCV_1804251 [Trichonephila clavipes]|nr:hypothetical protein TNCV_1804251 [Trichonephila clavipes]